jgi:hypothetical protein
MSDLVRRGHDALSYHYRSDDAVVCLYALIHMPLDAQPGLLRRAADWLRPAGWPRRGDGDGGPWSNGLCLVSGSQVTH